MKRIEQIRRGLRRISPEFLFLALLAVLLLAVALLATNNSWWAGLPLAVAVGMVLTVIFNDRPEAPQIWANDKPEQKRSRTTTIDPQNMKLIKRSK